MPHSRYRRRRFLACLGSIGWMLGWSRGASASDYVLVAHKGVRVTDSTLDKMKKILALRQAQWDDGAPVILVLPPRHSGPMLWISEELLRMPEATYRRLVLEQVFRGVARAPIQADSIAAAAQAVVTKPFTLTALPLNAVPEGVLSIVLR